VLNNHHIKKYASETGFSLCGTARARVLDEHAERFAAGLAASGEAALGYLVRDPARRLDPSRLLPGVRTVVVCALRYDGRAVETPGGRVSAHRREGDYQPRIKAMLSAVAERLQAGDPGLRAKVCCDTSAILEKAWAAEAGLGWIGRHSLLVNPSLGSYLLLGEILLDDECDIFDTPYSGPGCGGCSRCVDACPAGALVTGGSGMQGVKGGGAGRGGGVTGTSGMAGCGDGVTGTSGMAGCGDGGGVARVDTGRCISALTIEGLRRGLAAEPLHGWKYGCDECQSVGPYNKEKKVSIFFENQ
jgi:epoxyqueuosine reductase